MSPSERPARHWCRLGSSSFAGDEISVREALGVVEHGDHDRRHPEYAHVRCSRRWQWYGGLLGILQHS
jgi:hypothetical protein